MTTFRTLGAALALLVLTACGGGSAVDGGALATANDIAVAGKLASRDGTADALDGVTVTCVETGVTVVTDAQGAFHMQVPQRDEFHIQFHDPMSGDGGGMVVGPGEPHDPLRDDTEADGGGVRLRPGGPQDWCDIEVDLDGGEILECHVWWEHDGVEVHDGERHLDRDPLCDELNARGEVEFTLEQGCLSMEVEVQGFSRAAELDAYLEAPGGAQAYLGALQVDDEGAAHLERVWCAGDALPLDAAAPADLVGCVVVVYDESGSVVFRGPVSHHHGDDDFPHDHRGDGPSPGGEPGGPHHRGM